MVKYVTKSPLPAGSNGFVITVNLKFPLLGLLLMELEPGNLSRYSLGKVPQKGVCLSQGHSLLAHWDSGG